METTGKLIFEMPQHVLRGFKGQNMDITNPYLLQSLKTCIQDSQGWLWLLHIPFMGDDERGFYLHLKSRLRSLCLRLKEVE